MFKAFKHGGVQYLAVYRADDVLIVDEEENFYGSWYSVESFLQSAKKSEANAVGKAMVTVRGVQA